MIWDIFGGSHTDFDPFLDFWEFTGNLTDIPNLGNYCSSGALEIGGAGLFSPTATMQRTYTDLPTHDIIYYSIQMAAIDGWAAADSLTISFDGRDSFTWYPEPAITAY